MEIRGDPLLVRIIDQKFPPLLVSKESRQITDTLERTNAIELVNYHHIYYIRNFDTTYSEYLRLRRRYRDDLSDLDAPPSVVGSITSLILPIFSCLNITAVFYKY